MRRLLIRRLWLSQALTRQAAGAVERKPALVRTGRTKKTPLRTVWEVRAELKEALQLPAQHRHLQ